MIIRKNLLVLFLVFTIFLYQSCEKDDTKEIHHWSLLTSGIDNDLMKVFFTNPNCGYILSCDTVLLKTENAGNTWNAIPILQFDYNGMFFSTDSIGYLSTSNGLILKTNNGGRYWQPQWNETNFYLTSIFFTSPDVGYVVGEKFIDNVGVVLKTTDGGNSWSDLSGNISSDLLYSVYFTEENVGYVVGESGVLKTTDGGNSWKNILSDTEKELTSVYFVSKDIGFVSGERKVDDSGIILKTTDGGDTWLETESGTRHVGGLFFINNSTGYALSCDANLKGLILKTENSGLSWSIVKTDLTDVNFSSLFFTDLNHGYVVGEEGTILSWSE